LWFFPETSVGDFENQVQPNPNMLHHYVHDIFKIDTLYFDVHHMWQQGRYQLCNMHLGGCAPTIASHIL
jgi:hypothetical protein